LSDAPPTDVRYLGWRKERLAGVERKRGKKMRRLTFELVKVALATLTLVLLAVHAFAS
jgi:hypothetical protein